MRSRLEIGISATIFATSRCMPIATGKVERPISYVRQNFLYAREFFNDADLNQQAISWATQLFCFSIAGRSRRQGRAGIARPVGKPLTPALRPADAGAGNPAPRSKEFEP
jgi:hypothetical protein